MPEGPFWTKARVRAMLEWYREVAAVVAEGFDTSLLGADDYDSQLSICFIGKLGQVRREDPGGFKTQRGGCPPAVYALAEAKADIDRAIAALPAVQRWVVSLHYRDGLLAYEIASEVRIPAATVRSHLSRARENMLVFLEPSATLPPENAVTL